jgi:hypothetical protein
MPGLKRIGPFSEILSKASFANITFCYNLVKLLISAPIVVFIPRLDCMNFMRFS